MADRDRNLDREPSGIATADVWSLRDPSLNAADLVGFSVEATDGTIGKVDDATEEARRGHLIIDTGPWIFGKKVMLPLGVVERADLDAETIFVSRTKDEIKSAPPFELDLHREDEDYRSRLGDYYGRF